MSDSRKDLYGNEWCDIVDVQTTRENYSFKTVIEQAINVLNEDAGAVFEPNVIAAFKQLYRSDLASYNRYRQQVKEAKKVPMALFDKSILPSHAECSHEDGNAIDKLFPPLNVSENSVEGASLLDEIKQTIQLYVVADDTTINASTLWVCYTWFIDVVSYAPIANITAPEKRCGKTKLLSVLKRLSYKSLSTSNISAPALFRLIEKYKPITLLIDEVDSFLALHEDMRGIINAGFTRESAHIVRCAGDSFEPTLFDVWGAKALCGIGKLADTLQDRSIPLKLRRKQTGEVVHNVDRSPNEQWEQLRAKLARFAKDNQQKVLLATPNPIPQLNDRANDCWLPLLQVASVVGGHWLTTAIKTAMTINGAEEEPESTRTELLRDIKTLFDTKRIERIFSHDLVNALNEDNEANWCMWNRGKGMTARNLAKILREFDIISNTIRIGIEQRAKGYTKEQFKDAFNRYLTSAPIDTPITNVTTGQAQSYNKSSENNKRDISQMSRIEKPLQPSINKTCHVVTDKIPLTAGGDSEIDSKEPEEPTVNLLTIHSINELMDDDKGVYFDLD